LGKPCAAAQQCPNPCDHFLHLKRLGDIIVGSGVYAGDFLAPAVACGKDEDRRFNVCPPPALQNSQAIALRKAKIPNYGVARLCFTEVSTLFAIECGIGSISCLRERRQELTAQIPIIFYNKYPHAANFARSQVWRLSNAFPIRSGLSKAFAGHKPRS